MPKSRNRHSLVDAFADNLERTSLGSSASKMLVLVCTSYILEPRTKFGCGLDMVAPEASVGRARLLTSPGTVVKDSRTRQCREKRPPASRGLQRREKFLLHFYLHRTETEMPVQSIHWPYLPFLQDRLLPMAAQRIRSMTERTRQRRGGI